MDVWAWSARMGLLFGLLAFALVFVPVLIAQIRRYGRVSAGRLLGAAAVSVYVAAIASYTWLPLPQDASEAWCAAHGIHEIQLTSFAFVDDVLEEAAKVGWASTMTSHALLQVVFNVVLFVPWGVLVRGYLHRSFGAAVLTGALASLLVEATQATGLWFAYPCAYRLADVDDLMMNTLGAAVGALLAPALLFWMPRREALDAARLEPRPITTGRRLLSMFVTWAAATLVAGLFSAVARFAAHALGLVLDPAASGWLDAAAGAIAVILVIYVPAARGAGSLGHYTVWIAPRWRSGTGALWAGPLWARLARASVIGIPMLLSSLHPGGWADALVGMVGLVSAGMAPFSSTHRSLSGWLTGATMVDTRAEAPRGDSDRGERETPRR